LNRSEANQSKVATPSHVTQNTFFEKLKDKVFSRKKLFHIKLWTISSEFKGSSRSLTDFQPKIIKVSVENVDKPFFRPLTQKLLRATLQK